MSSKGRRRASVVQARPPPPGGRHRDDEVEQRRGPEEGRRQAAGHEAVRQNAHERCFLGCLSAGISKDTKRAGHESFRVSLLFASTSRSSRQARQTDKEKVARELANEFAAPV